MAKKKLPVRIFISSPGDVIQERNLAFQLIEQLKYERGIKGKIALELVAWDKPGEETPFFATMTPQEAININKPKPSQCDIVIVILWSRMGTPLPYPEYKKPDTTPYLSGTEWEFLDAVSASNKSGKPQVIVYRRIEKIYISPADADFVEKSEQWKLVEDFFKTFANPDGSIGKGYHQYPNVEHFQQLLETHLRQLIQSILKRSSEKDYLPNAAEEEIWSTSPFPGLRAFTEHDEPIFFGRTKETHDLIKRLEDTSFIAVIGASGSGKSSLVGAGLVAQLKKNVIEGSKNWLYLRFSPGEIGANPLTALTAKLSTVINTPLKPTELADILEREPVKVKDICQNALKGKPKWAKLFIFIDQFEELFTLVERQYIDAFINVLEEALASKRVRILITLRSDFYHQCVANLTLGRWLQEGSYPLPIPKKFSLLQMITRPAQRAALAFEDGLPEQIVNDTGEEAGALALMAYTLDELYHNRSETGQLTFDLYNKIGKVQGAIGERAEKSFQALSSDAQICFTRVFRELVEVDERGVTTRRRTSLQEIIGDNAGARDLVEAFVKARLLVVDRNTVEVAHEALLKNWKTLAQWIEDRQGDLRLLKQIREAAKEWHTKDRRKDYLWSHERLQPVYVMLERLELQPELLLKEFIKPEYERLFDELNDPNTYDYRRQAIGDRLAQIGEPALPVLIQTFHNKDKWLRAVAARSLIQIGTTAIPFLEPILLIEPEIQVKRRVLRILSAIGITSIPFLMTAFHQMRGAFQAEIAEVILTLIERMGGVSNKDLGNLKKNLTNSGNISAIKKNLLNIFEQVGATEIYEVIEKLDFNAAKRVEDNFLEGIDPIAWLESLAARQGATEGFTTAHDIKIQEIDPDSVVIDEPGYTPSETIRSRHQQPPSTPNTLPEQPRPVSLSADFGLPDGLDPLAWLESLAASQGEIEEINDIRASVDELSSDMEKALHDSNWLNTLVLDEPVSSNEAVLANKHNELGTNIYSQNEVLDSISDLSDEEITQMQIAGTLTPVQELAWLERQVKQLAKVRQQESLIEAEPDEEVGQVAEIPAWLLFEESEPSVPDIPDWLIEDSISNEDADLDSIMKKIIDDEKN